MNKNGTGIQGETACFIRGYAFPNYCLHKGTPLPSKVGEAIAIKVFLF